ncbi:hypothetical protein IB257_30310 [Achromobacter sp. ACM03]|nr:hypothetical protein [Achromobacter sp. ACM03]MBD9434251.1 hypothetical protein [Achromobacter sp. ACM03]
MKPWPYDEYFTLAQFDALPIAQQRLIVLIVRALVYYLERFPDEAAGLD